MEMNMGHSCCGGHGGKEDCCRKGGDRRGQSALLWGVVLALLVVGAAVASVALADPPASTPAVQPASPAAAPAPKTSEPAAKPEELTKGVIRHGRAEPIAKPAGAIRIATYNVENLFDSEMTPGRSELNPVKPVEERQAVAEAIHKINADVIAMDEIESKDVVTKFRDQYLADMGYSYIASIDAGDSRGIEQSVLSRYPIKDETNWPRVPLGMNHPEKLGKKHNPDAGKPLVLHRSPMRVTITVPGSGPDAKPTDITLFAVHHKSGPYYGYEREAEARKTLELVHEFEKEHPGEMVIVLGDFNARITEPPLEVYTKGGMSDAFAGVPGGVESKEFTSHVSGRTIDHILVNGAAAAKVIPETRFVLGTPQRPADVDWRHTPPPPGYGSDHYPVVVDFHLDSAAQQTLNPVGK
jgi:endonuclease/exonuclease/phosphatase family metal-dependent hydrolase